MKIISILSIMFSLALTSCSSGSHYPNSDYSNNEQEDELSNLPAWVFEPDIEGGIAAVGIASSTRGGPRFQIPKAKMDAKANIAEKIQSEISRVTKEALRQAKVNDVEDVEEVFSQATKDVVKNMPLSGATIINKHKAEDGTLYLHMMLKDKDFSRYFQRTQRIYEDLLKAAKMSRGNLDKSQEAVQELFDELEEERGKN